jgi:hypothetical protein
MAIYSSVAPPSQQPAQSTTSSIEIEAWSVSALQSLNISPSARGAGASLSIPFDTSDDVPAKSPSYKPRKEPLKRDSQRRREALLKGKEGSRRRQRWENGELCLYCSSTRYSLEMTVSARLQHLLTKWLE